MIMVKYRIFLEKTKEFSLEVGRHFIKNNCDNRAEALTFSSILSLVPLLTIFLSMLMIFPGFSQFARPIEDFIFNHFLPNTGDTLQFYFHDFINRALKLSAVSLIFLWIVAIKMIFSIEKAFDAIWSVKLKRPFISATILYGSMLILLPLLLGAMWMLRFYSPVFSFFFHAESIVWLKKMVLDIFPFGLMVGIFFMLYTVIPHAKTLPKPALLGALFSTVLLWGIKNIFVWSMKNFTSYDWLYGTLSLIPAFLIWVYCIWFIVLLGATVSYVLQNTVYFPQIDDSAS